VTTATRLILIILEFVFEEKLWCLVEIKLMTWPEI